MALSIHYDTARASSLVVSENTSLLKCPLCKFFFFHHTGSSVLLSFILVWFAVAALEDGARLSSSCMELVWIVADVSGFLGASSEIVVVSARQHRCMLWFRHNSFDLWLYSTAERLCLFETKMKVISTQHIVVAQLRWSGSPDHDWETLYQDNSLILPPYELSY